MRRLVMMLMAGLVAGTVFLAATAGAHSAAKKPKGPKCSVQSAGGVPASGALGGWSYSVSFSCPFRLRSFSVHTNKHFRTGVDKFGTRVPYAYARLKNGQQANFTCKDTSTKSVKCTVSPTLSARIQIVDAFDSSTKCKNTKKGKFNATLTVNGRKIPAVFAGKTTSGSLIGGCG